MIPGADPAVRLSKSDLIALISDRRIDTSGAFYGVGAPEVVDNICHAVPVEYINEHWNGTPEDRPSAIRFNSQWAIEKDGRCQLEIQRDPHGPEHVFGDTTDFIPVIWRRRCGLDGSRGWTNERLEQSYISRPAGNPAPDGLEDEHEL